MTNRRVFILQSVIGTSALASGAVMAAAPMVDENDGAAKGLGYVAPAARRFVSDYRDPAVVLRDMAEAYPKKLIWGSDTPFQSYVAHIDGTFVSLRSTYAAETACVHALPEPLRRAVGQDNLLSLLQLKHEHILTRG